MLNFFTDGPFHLEPWRFDALYVAAFALGWPKGAAANRRAQQDGAIGKFREKYNQVCPHEALAMETPAAYQGSPRRLATFLL
jgi:transposase InsO family protein